jgi:hypothetical protein
MSAARPLYFAQGTNAKAISTSAMGQRRTSGYTDDAARNLTSAQRRLKLF